MLERYRGEEARSGVKMDLSIYDSCLPSAALYMEKRVFSATFEAGLAQSPGLSSAASSILSVAASQLSSLHLTLHITCRQMAVDALLADQQLMCQQDTQDAAPNMRQTKLVDQEFSLCSQFATPLSLPPNSTLCITHETLTTNLSEPYKSCEQTRDHCKS